MTKKNKAVTISLRLTGDLKDVVDKALEKLKMSKTEFLEIAIKDKIKRLAETDPEIKKMIDATKRTVTVLD